MSRSFLQTTEWLKFQESMGHKTWRFDDGPVRGKTPSEMASVDAPGAQRTSNGIKANIIKLGLPMGKSMFYVPHGPEIDFEHVKGGLKNELSNFIKYLKDLAKKEKAIFIKIEPLSDIVIELMYRRGFKRSSKQIQPYKTVVMDLNLSEEELLSGMHQKTRYNIKVAEKNGIVVRQCPVRSLARDEVASPTEFLDRLKHGQETTLRKDLGEATSNGIDEFWELMKKTTKRDRFAAHSKDYYAKLIKLGGQLKTDLFFAYSGEKPFAGAIVLRYGDTGYYLHGASDYESRAMMAPYALHWEIMKKLKIDGYKFYDFWGIDASKWPGVTRFKLGWGGDIKEHPGSFDLPVSRFWYLVYSLARRVF